MLIDKTEISKHREVSRNVRDEKINPHIEDAEFLDLKPLLGEQLYQDLITNSTEDKYIDILQPKEYEHNGLKYRHQGLNKVLSLFSYARYVLHGSFTDTGLGLVQKTNQDSQPVSDSHKRNLYTKDRQAATAYFNEVALYMTRNYSTYPEWNVGCYSKSPKMRISKITR